MILMCLIFYFLKCNEKKEKKLEHDKKENNLRITPK
jgi:preprotein translocase subunit YajC